MISYRKRAVLAALCFLLLAGCGRSGAASSPSVTASQPSSSQAQEADPVYVADFEELFRLPEYQEAWNAGKNLVGYLLPEAIINQDELSAFLDACEDGGDAVLELQSFSWCDYSLYQLNCENGVVANKGWTRLYGSSEPVDTWDVGGIDFVELLCKGELFLRGGREYEDGTRSDLSFPVYSDNLDNPFAQVYSWYLKNLEFNHLLGDSVWDIEDPNSFLGSMTGFFEAAYQQEHGSGSLWNDYPDGDFPASVYEGTIQRFFDVPSEALRSARNSIYDPEKDVYHYEGGRGGAYFATTRILSVEEKGDLLLITYCEDQLSGEEFEYQYEFVDGKERIRRGEDRYLLTILLTASDGFRYLSNQKSDRFENKIGRN